MEIEKHKKRLDIISDDITNRSEKKSNMYGIDI